MKIEMILCMIFLSSVISACANEPMKAPCDSQAHFCGAKTKINRW